MILMNDVMVMVNVEKSRKGADYYSYICATLFINYSSTMIYYAILYYCIKLHTFY